MMPAASGSRSVSVVLPESTCAKIPKFSVFCGMRHTLRRRLTGLFDGHERLAHLRSLVDRCRSVTRRNHTGDASLCQGRLQTCVKDVGSSELLVKRGLDPQGVG